MDRDERLERLLRECQDIAARRFAEGPLGGSPSAELLRIDEDPADAIIAALRAAPRVTPRETFRVAARERLLERIAAPVPAPTRLRRRHLLPRIALRFAASVVIMLSLTSGAIVVSANSLPDEPLYLVKTAVEEAQLRTTLEPAERVRLHLQFAKRRIAEIEAASEVRPAAAAVATERYERELRAAAEVLRESPDLSREPVVKRVEGELRQHEAVLHDVLQRAPAEVRPAVEQALEVSRQGRAYVERVKAGETAPPLAPIPPQPVSAAPPAVPPVNVPPPVVVQVPPAAEQAEAATPRSTVERDVVPRPLPGSIGDVRPMPAPSAASGGKTPEEAGKASPIHGLPEQPILAMPWPLQPDRTPTAVARRDAPVVTAEQRGSGVTTTVEASTMLTATTPSPTPTPAVVVPPLPITPIAPLPEAQSPITATAPVTGTAPVGSTSPVTGTTSAGASTPVTSTAPADAAGSNQPPEWRRADEIGEPQVTPTPTPAPTPQPTPTQP
jgi:hypothetical protein